MEKENGENGMEKDKNMNMEQLKKKVLVKQVLNY